MKYTVAFEPHLDSINLAFRKYFENRKDINFTILQKPQVREKSSMFLLKALWFRIKMLFLLGKYDIVHINSAKFGIVAFFASFIRCRYIYTIHFASDEERKGGLKNYLLWLMEVSLLRLVAKRAASVTAVSEYCAQEIKRKYGINAVVIHNGYDEELFNDTYPDRTIREQLAPGNTPVFISVGRMIEYKKPLNVIKFFTRIKEAYPQAKLLFIGDGELYDKVIVAISENNLFDDVITIKRIDFQLMPRYYHAADYFISACESEALGLVCLEALACKAVPLVPWKGAFPEIFLDKRFSYDVNETGKVVLPERKQLLADRLKILARFNWQEKIGQYEEIYKKMIL